MINKHCAFNILKSQEIPAETLNKSCPQILKSIFIMVDMSISNIYTSHFPVAALSLWWTLTFVQKCLLRAHTQETVYHRSMRLILRVYYCNHQHIPPPDIRALAQKWICSNVKQQHHIYVRQQPKNIFILKSNFYRHLNNGIITAVASAWTRVDAKSKSA